MGFCPVPHTTRDQVWVAVGAIIGACAVGYSLRQKRVKKTSCTETKISYLSCESWGIHPQTKEEVSSWTLRNDLGMEVKITSLGCAVTSVVVPTKTNEKRDIVCGYDNLTSCLRGKQNFGTIVGRCANRIAKGKFTIDGNCYQLAVNNGVNHLHGGPTGFFSRNFKCVSAVVTEENVSLTLGYHSIDGEEGYPGAVDLTMVYTLPRRRNALEMGFGGQNATAPTILSMTNHCYWNLLGHNSGQSVASHELSMPNCQKYTAMDDTAAVTGELRSVINTHLDFCSRPRLLGPKPSFDLNYCIDDCKADQRALRLAASLKVSDLEMKVLTDAPGIQVYSGGFINPAANAQWLVAGKEGMLYQQYGAVCLETQNWPDAVNQASFPYNSLLRPGQKYSHLAVYEFL